jgi:hypothetical protein
MVTISSYAASLTPILAASSELKDFNFCLDFCGIEKYFDNSRKT